MDAETIEHGRKLYEALIRADNPGAECAWEQVSTSANGASDVFALTVTLNGRSVNFPRVSFDDLERLAVDGDPKIEQRVREIMASNR